MKGSDTITARATPSGIGGVGIVRVSGPKAYLIAQAITHQNPQPRQAHFCEFKDENNQIIDHGIALYFKGPNSFTGEDVVELQGHGGPVVMELLLKRVVQLGARLAKPGEFSERAFLNNRIDLTQAEAVADLIHAQSEQAVRCAARSLQGEFSTLINRLVESLIQLRMYVEAAIDFPEEEIDFLSDSPIEAQLNQLISELKQILQSARQGVVLQEGMRVVIIGKPNAGKSSLLNYLSGEERAIVTDIPGTTRDILRERILIDGMPLHIIDTAGLRESADPVEREGIRRAVQEIQSADRILLLIDLSDPDQSPENVLQPFQHQLPQAIPLTIIGNKIDLVKKSITRKYVQNPFIPLSAKTGEGVDKLRHHLKECMGYQTIENGFIARRRHLEALNKALSHLHQGKNQLHLKAGELLAEELKQAQQHLSEITGAFTSDDLLGRIFSSFCIGK